VSGSPSVFTFQIAISAVLLHCFGCRTAISDISTAVGGPAAVIPNLDSISEFRIIMDNFSAEYGHFSAGQVKSRF
jgi:hypothetical protein